MTPRLERIGSLEAARADWTALADAGDNPFSTWEWADAWWRHLGGHGELWLHRAVTPDGRVAALLPLYRRRRGPAEVVRFVGHGPADQLGPVCAPADRPFAAAALRALAARLPRRALLLAERLAGEDGVAEALGAHPVRTEATPLLHAPDGWEAWLASRSSNFRGQVRRRERKLVREHGLRFRFQGGPGEQLETDLRTLVELHDRRWQGASSAFAGARRPLHEDFARAAAARGWLRLWIAESGDGTPVAAWYGLRFAGREWYYQAGRDPDWAGGGDGVGFALLAHTIRAALEDGVTEYRFGLGDEPYKERFANGDPGLRTVVLGRGPLPAAAAAAAAGARRLPPRARQVLARRAA